MEKLKIATIVGTRPELIRLSEIIKKFDSLFNHIFIHTGQNWSDSLNEIFYTDLGIRKPDYFLECVGNNLGDTIGNIISSSYKILNQIKPDGILILGDTNSSLSAIAAKRLKIPVFHMEAGNRCFDENLPEEINRRIVDHISDVNLPYTEHARRYLLSEGVIKDRIYVTGSPIKEVLMANMEKINSSKILDNLGLIKDEYIVLSTHREENIDNESNFKEIMLSLEKISSKYNKKIIFSAHPRTANKMEKNNIFFDKDKVVVIDPLNYTDYNNLQMNSFIVLSDSGTLPEEASILKFDGISIRTSTERPEALEKGNFILGGTTYKEIIQAIDVTKILGNVKFSTVSDYEDILVSSKVASIIQSYIKVINKKVWDKN